ncbi:MAG: PHP domain-containing protein [Methylococcaceae bacterium]|nr:PHP domain-containing protein [Methylococcaceae bacterium]
MTLRYDLHCHSTASDGALSPRDLVSRAFEQGVNVLALTDHDTVDGLGEARLQAQQLGIRLINGIELSCTHLNQCLHIVGLNIDPDHPGLREGLSKQQALRDERAKRIADKLAKKGIPGVYEAVLVNSGKGEITRTHFAEYLLRQAYVNSMQEAFDRYLNKGQPAYVSTSWASLEEVVSWIVNAGGIAVLAHPLRYKLSNKWINRALAVFKEAGGQGIEVVNGRGSLEEVRLAQQFAERHQLVASTGSDFHAPDTPYLELGRLVELPATLIPVWSLFPN